MALASQVIHMVIGVVLLSEIAVEKIQGSKEYKTFDELTSDRGPEEKIKNTDCVFQTEQGSNCLTKYTKKSGSCTLLPTVNQLFQTLNLKELTKNFVLPEKLSLEELTINSCESNKEVKFKLKTLESYDVVPKYIVLAAESGFVIEWNNSGSEVQLEDIKIVVDGVTSIGDDHNVNVKIEKAVKRDDYELNFVVGSLSVRDFLAKFDINANDMKPTQASASSAAVFGEGMATEKQKIGLNSLNFPSPTLKGVLSPGAGFEITVKGRPAAPKLISDAANAYLIVQDFKKADADVPAEDEVYETPAAALFCGYDGDTISGIIYSLTGYMVPPRMALIKDVSKIAITAATKSINFINTPELRQLVEEFTPKKGFDMIEKGLNVLHYSPGSNVVAKDEDTKPMEKVLFRAEIQPDKISWKTPQMIQGTMKEMGAMVWPKPNGIDRYPIKPSTKTIYDSIDYTKASKTISVNFNLTEKIDVIEGGLVSLLNASLRIYSTANDRGKYRRWKLVGSGNEAILDELVDIKVKNDDDNLIVEAKSGLIFSMTEVRNRTKATYLPDDYAEAFNNSLNFAISGVRYVASFADRQVLRFTGTVEMAENSILEILYEINAAGANLKVGVVFKDDWLHEKINLLYQKTAMQTAWMKFDDIAVVYKKEQFPADFSNEMMKIADSSNTDGGIGVVANVLHLDNCGEAKFCSFLNTRYGDRFSVTFRGKATKEKLGLFVKVPDVVKIGEGVDLVDVTARIACTPEKGDKVSLGGNFIFRRTGEQFQGGVFSEDVQNVMMKAGDHKQGSKDMFALPYVEMKPLNILTEIGTGYVDILEYKSRLHIGLPESRQMEFSGGISRQYVGLNDAEYLRFFASKTNTPLRNIYKCFAKTEPMSIIKGAKFDGTMVVAYNSKDEAWKIKEMGQTIDKGFFYLGNIALKSGDIFPAKVKLTDALEIETEVQFPPIVIGDLVSKDVQVKIGTETLTQEKVVNENVSLAMYQGAKVATQGPVLIVGSNGKQTIKGFIKTIGLEGEFTMDVQLKDKIISSNLVLEGKIYNEVQGKITLTSQGKDFPVKLVNKAEVAAARRRTTGEAAREDQSSIPASWVYEQNYRLDLTKQAASSAGGDVKAAIKALDDDAGKGNTDAEKQATEMQKLFDEYSAEEARYKDKMASIQDEIRITEQGIDDAIFDITEECISKCRTVTIPDVDYKGDCSKAGDKKLPCLEWSESKNKVVNVQCLIKCEAKKISAANTAYGDLHNIRTLLNRYKELKTLSDNLQPLIALLEKGKNVADDTKQMVEDSTDIKGPLKKLTADSTNSELATINKLLVDEPIKGLKPPCLPFQLDFVLHTQPPRSHNGKYDICFNGEFFNNLGTQILRSSFPKIDKMYKALEEANLRYVQLDGIKNSLTRVKKEMTADSASRRSSIPDATDMVEDAIMAQLMRTAERRVPKFTVKSDRTVMGFMHYSPWALASRSDPFSGIQLPNAAAAYKPQFNGTSCRQAKYVVGEYRDIIKGLHTVSENYRRGKVIFQSNKEKVYQEMKETYNELNKLANLTNLRPEEVKEMYYWYEYTKAGMDTWLQGMSRRLVEHNNRGMAFWRAEMKGMYGAGTHIDDLAQMGHEAYARSNVGHNVKKSSSNVLQSVRNGIQDLMGNPKLTLEEVRPALNRLSGNIESLRRSSVSCY